MNCIQSAIHSKFSFWYFHFNLIMFMFCFDFFLYFIVVNVVTICCFLYLCNNIISKAIKLSHSFSLVIRLILIDFVWQSIHSAHAISTRFYHVHVSSNQIFQISSQCWATAKKRDAKSQWITHIIWHVFGLNIKFSNCQSIFRVILWLLTTNSSMWQPILRLSLFFSI